MSERVVSLHPVDAWFFRDGRPYDLDGATQAWVESQFPPPAPTVVGALRLALARGRGFSGRGSWSPALAEVLGDGPRDLGALRFVGPRLRREGEDRKGEDLFPLPRHVQGEFVATEARQTDREASWQPRDFLAPASEPVVCDLGDAVSVRVPQRIGMSARKLPLGHRADRWVTATGLAQVLAGRLPPAASIVAAEALWRLEARVGLERKEDTRTAVQGALYSPSYVRLERGVSLVIGLAGVPAAWTLPATLALGGESRMARCEVLDGSLLAPACPDKDIARAEAG